VQGNFFCRLGSAEGPGLAGRPAPARGEDRGKSKSGLFPELADAFGVEILEDVGQGKLCCSAKAMLRPLSVAAAWSFEVGNCGRNACGRARPQALLDSAAEGSVDDELHAAAFVEEALGE